jgi:hypothetical protein
MIRIIACTALLLSSIGMAAAAPPEAQKPTEQLPGPPAPGATVGTGAAATATAPVSPDVYSAGTVKQFLNVCGGDQGGCADEVGNALINKMVFDGSTSICLPGPDYAAAAVKWLNAHPEAQNMPTQDGIFLALQKTYPCAG